MGLGRDAFRLGYEFSPIILTGGAAAGIPGSMLPIVLLTQAVDFALSILGGASDGDLDQYFARFVPMPGGTLIDNQFGTYPFANQSVAANAVIPQPLQIALRMICPVQTKGGYFSKTLTMIALQQVLAAHINAGGLFTVATPSFFYTNCLLQSVRDITNGQSHQVQTDWEWVFVKPLITQNDAAGAYSSLMGKMANGLPTGDNPTWSGVGTSVGSTSAVATASVVPAAQNLPATAIAAPAGVPTEAALGVNRGF